MASAGSIGAAYAGAARARPRRRMYLTNVGAASLSAPHETPKGREAIAVTF